MCIVVRPLQDKNIFVSVSISQVQRNINKKLRWIHPSYNFVTFPGAVCENANQLAAKSQAHFSSCELKPRSKEFRSVQKFFFKKAFNLPDSPGVFIFFYCSASFVHFLRRNTTLGVGQRLAQLASEVSSDNTLLPSVLFSQVVHH